MKKQIPWTVETLVVGCILQVKTKNPLETHEATILQIREIADGRKFYVHFTGYNSRLDEWVTSDRLTLQNVKAPVAIRDSMPKSSTPTASRPRRSVRKRQVLDESNDTSIDFDSTQKSLTMAQNSLSNEASKEMKIRNIELIQLGHYHYQPWYFSPYPPELCTLECIYLCDFCLRPNRSKFVLTRHYEKCKLISPPGKKIYEKDDIAFFEIDGQKYETYAKYLCLLGKLFLDHKTVYYDISIFLFYVMTKKCDTGYQTVGYFSKEKVPQNNYNLACILILPGYQKHGYGQLLIEFSYELSKIEGKKGSPEKPLSDLGLLSYRSYWRFILVETILKKIQKVDSNSLSNLNNNADENIETKATISVSDLMKLTSMTKEDVISTLQLNRMHFYKGNDSVICLSKEAIVAYEIATKKRPIRIDPDAIKYTPVDWKSLLKLK